MRAYSSVMSYKKTLVVIGGSSGIGRATVELALEEGWRVAFTYCHNEGKAKTFVDAAKQRYPSQLCLPYKLDVTDSTSIEGVCVQIQEDFEEVGAVVYSAGIDMPGNAMMMELATWRQVIETNLTGAFLTAQCFLPMFIANRYGRFVTISSLAKDGSSGQLAYATTKAGLVGFTRTIAKEYGAMGITANTVVPGLIQTDIIGDDEKGINEYFKKYGPSKKLGEPDDIARSILFFCDEKSSYVNGSDLHVTGGIDWVF